MKFAMALVGYGLLVAPFILFAALSPPVAATFVESVRRSWLWNDLGSLFLFHFLPTILIGAIWVVLLFWSAWIASKRLPGIFARLSMLAATILVVLYVIYKIVLFLSLPMGSGDAP